MNRARRPGLRPAPRRRGRQRPPAQEEAAQARAGCGGLRPGRGAARPRDGSAAAQLADDDLWLPTSRKQVADDLVEALHDRNHAVVVGEPGVGKTCTLRALRKRLPEANFRLTYCHNATLGRRDFYRQLSQALGLPAKATAAGVFYALTNQVQELSRSNVHPVFLLDEAQLMRDDVLQHLHILSNYQWDR